MAGTNLLREKSLGRFLLWLFQCKAEIQRFHFLTGSWLARRRFACLPEIFCLCMLELLALGPTPPRCHSLTGGIRAERICLPSLLSNLSFNLCSAPMALCKSQYGPPWHISPFLLLPFRGGGAQKRNGEVQEGLMSG